MSSKDTLDHQITSLTCRVITPTRHLLTLKARKETIQASALLMRTRKCGLDKAHFVRSALSASVARSVRKQLLADFNRFTTADTHDANIYLAVSHMFWARPRVQRDRAALTDVRVS